MQSLVQFNVYLLLYLCCISVLNIKHKGIYSMHAQPINNDAKINFTCAWRCRKVAQIDLPYGQTLPPNLPEWNAFKLEHIRADTHIVPTVCVLSTCQESAGRRSVMETAVCCTLTGSGGFTADCSEDQRPPEARRRAGLSWQQPANYWSSTVRTDDLCLLLPRVHLCSSSEIRKSERESAIINPSNMTGWRGEVIQLYCSDVCALQHVCTVRTI